MQHHRPPWRLEWVHMRAACKVPKAERLRALLKCTRQHRDWLASPALLDETLRPLVLIHGRFLQPHRLSAPKSF
jgi:hypothetical protein